MAKQKQKNSNWFVLAAILLANSDKVNEIYQSLPLLFTFFFSSGSLVLLFRIFLKLLEENSQFFKFNFATLSPQIVIDLDAGLDGKI